MSTTTLDRPRPTTTTGDVRFVDLPDRRYLAVDGTGMPDTGPGPSAAFQEALQALYGVGYGLHFALKRRGVNAGVGSLEAIWSWGEDGDGPPPETAAAVTATTTHWTALLPLPDEATEDDVVRAMADLLRKKAPPALERLHVETLHEGPSAEVMHIGPYDAEQPTIERLHAAIAATGHRPRGRHHEIYLGDPRRAAPSKLRTLIRQPID